MDTPTHILLGAVTAQLGFRQRIGPEATWVAAGAAILPDLDILVVPFLSLTGAELDELASLAIHRGLSHSLLASVILSLPVALIWWWFRRRNRRHALAAPSAPNPASRDRKGADDLSDPKRARRRPPFWLLYACVLVALLAAPLLDWCTSYGTQLLAPLTNKRYAIDVVPIVDIIYTPLLILTLLACHLVRRISRGQAVRATLIIGWVGFLLSVAYLASGRVMHNWAARQARHAAGVAQEKIIAVDAYPAIGTIFLWRTVVETDDEWIAMRAHRFSRQPPEAWARQTVAKADNRWVRRARQLPEGRTYDWFTGHRTRASYSLEGGQHVVELHDMRYCWPLEGVESFWPLTVIFSSDGELLRVGRERRYRRGPFSSWVARAWADIWNP